LYAEFLTCTSLDHTELLGLAHGNLVSDAPLKGVPQLPAPPLLMFDRVVVIERCPPRGRMVAEQEIRPDAWYFQCHFRDDPVQPGCLGIDGLWQMLGLFCGLSGTVGAGRALGCGAVEFNGQVRPYDALVRYELDIRRFVLLKESGAGIAVGDGRIFVNGEKIYTAKSMRSGVFTNITYRDFPDSASVNARGGVMTRSNDLK
jgi:3-hydroxyacyl-[acyl-carrier protein] dehydratase/trans-2-decenoyl-[acyl-carrier protein] isomerase